MHTVTIRFYEELNDFLPRAKRKKRYRTTFREARSVKDLIEAEGVPHTEIDLLLVNGEPSSFDALIEDGCDISVFPKFESLNIASLPRPNREGPLRGTPCFVADVHLGKLTRRLRLLGFDCQYNRHWDDPDLAAVSQRENRVLLTRDRGLLMRNAVTHGIFIRSDHPDTQCREVLHRLDLHEAIRPWTRCITCNGQLQSVEKTQIQDRVPAYTYKTQNRFCECTECGKVYWQGTHWPKLKRFIEQITGEKPEGTDEGDRESVNQ